MALISHSMQKKYLKMKKIMQYLYAIENMTIIYMIENKCNFNYFQSL
jgi:hypothetical protein